MTSSDLKNQQETRLHFWNVVKRNVKKIIPQNQQDLSRFMVEAIPENMLINLVQLIKCGYELVIESNGERIAY